MKERDFPSALWLTDPDADLDNKGVVGLLSFDGQSYLQLDIPAGVLLDWPKTPTSEGYMQCHTVEGLHAEEIYGFSQAGNYYLLRDVSSLGPALSVPGFEKQTLRGASLFASRQRIDRNPITQSIAARFPGLREWTGVIPFQVGHKHKDGVFKELSFSFNREDVDDLDLYEDENIKVSIGFINTRKGVSCPNYEFAFETDCELRIAFKDEGHLFEEAMDAYVYPIINFLTFCMGFRYAISSIWFTTTENIKVEYIAPLVGSSKSPSGDQLRSMPLFYKRIQQKIYSMISCWLGFDGYARNSSTLVTSLLNDWNMPLDMLFLASAQALEAASRSGVDEREISDEDLEKKLADIRQSDLKSRSKSWVCHKLKDAKWKNANFLLGELIKKLGTFPAFVVPDVSAFMKDHRGHRDAYTHRRDLDEEHRLSSENLFIHTEAVQLLTYGAIALFLGLNPEEIIDVFKESGYRSNSLYRANQLYAISDDRDVDAE